MKILLLASSDSFSISKIFNDTLIKMGHDVIIFNPIRKKHNKIVSVLKSQLRKHSDIKDYFDRRFYQENNMKIINKFEETSPDLVISYNDSFLLPEAVDRISKKSKIMFFLGDNPFYSFQKKYFLQILLKANMVITPDTGCKEQLLLSGVRNVKYSILGINKDTFYKMDISRNEIKEYRNEIFYLGSIHNIESWAYKRPIMLSKLLNYDISIFGNRTWKKILPEFPELSKKFTLLKKPMSYEELNLRMNCSKIYPVDAHPGIIKGLHARIFDAISAGILPIVEYREDLEIVFDKVSPPSYRSLDELENKVEYYLTHDKERKGLANELHDYVTENYNSEKCIKRIIKSVL
jgi:spore maturation protein CgeB